MMEYIFLLNVWLSLKLKSLRDRQTQSCRVYLASMSPACPTTPITPTICSASINLQTLRSCTKTGLTCYPTNRAWLATLAQVQVAMQPGWSARA